MRLCTCCLPLSAAFLHSSKSVVSYELNYTYFFPLIIWKFYLHWQTRDPQAPLEFRELTALMWVSLVFYLFYSVPKIPVCSSYNLCFASGGKRRRWEGWSTGNWYTWWEQIWAEVNHCHWFQGICQYAKPLFLGAWWGCRETRLIRNPWNSWKWCELLYLFTFCRNSGWSIVSCYDL